MSNQDQVTRQTPATKVLVSGNNYHIFKHDGIKNKLPLGSYEFRFSPQGPYLEKQEDLVIPDKVYSNDASFIKHVLHSFDNLEKGLLGVGLVGEKGLGKSFTANILAQKVELPVLKLTQAVGGTSFLDMLKQLEQDYVLYIDEFEKLFPTSFDSDDQRASQEELLSFLDGGLPGNNKVLFMITSNSKYKISDFLKNRPSRLRYFKEYLVLDEVIIKEVIEDLLENQEFLEDLLDALPYKSLNLDSLIKIIEEINTHNMPYSQFKSFFNFQEDAQLDFSIDVVLDNGDRETIGSFNRALYGDMGIGKSKKFKAFADGAVKSAPTIYTSGDVNLDENPREEVEIEGYYYQRKSIKDPTQNEIPVRLIIYPNFNRLANHYEYAM